MNPEIYLFAIFVFGLAYLFLVIIRRMRRKDPQSQSQSFEQQNKLFRMYQNLEDLMDSFEAYAEDKQKALEDTQCTFADRCQTIEARCADIERRCQALEEARAQRSMDVNKNPMPVMRVPSFERVHAAAEDEAKETSVPRLVKMPLEQNPMPIIQPGVSLRQFDAQGAQNVLPRAPLGEPDSLALMPNLAIKRSYEPVFEDLEPITLASYAQDAPARVSKLPPAADSAAAPMNKRARILAMYQSGMSHDQMARELGITRTEIAMICDMAQKTKR